MRMTVRYHSRDDYDQRVTTIDPAGDAIAVHLPPQPELGLPGLIITINSDAVVVDAAGGTRLGSLDFCETAAEARRG